MLDEKNIICVEGKVQGTIVVPKIEKGYGFEPFFIPEGSQKTLVEMDVKEKNVFSHRGKAVAVLLDRFESL